VWCEKVKKWFYKVDAAQLLANFWMMPESI
jgi:hypothetical protein